MTNLRTNVAGVVDGFDVLGAECCMIALDCRVQDMDPLVPGDLGQNAADTAAGPVDQKRLPRPDPGAAVQHLVGRDAIHHNRFHQALALEQIGQAGASARSLKAIATQMGMSAPALYRYFSRRDELLTQLVLSIYQDLAELIEAAAEGQAKSGRRLTDIARTLRHLAVVNPQHYLLLYGTPVPGYHAPPEATALAQRIFAPILAGFAALLDQAAASGWSAEPSIGRAATSLEITSALAALLNRLATSAGIRCGAAKRRRSHH